MPRANPDQELAGDVSNKLAHADGVGCSTLVPGIGSSSTAWSGISQLWQTIQIGPGVVIRRSRRWRSPHSSQVMDTRITPQVSILNCYSQAYNLSKPGYGLKRNV